MATATLLPSVLPLLWASPGFAAAYLWFALGLGPRIMRGREPLRPKTVLAVYNALQVALNVAMLCKSVSLFVDRRYDLMCPRAQPPLHVVMGDSQAHAFALEVARVAHYQASMRLLDLADTVFIVLAKKTRHLTFLHLYHHCSVILFAWTILKIDIGGTVTLLPASINNFVHATMYSYYLLSLFGFQLARSCKKYITQLQILQFVLVVLYLLQAIMRKDCDTSLPIIGLNFTQGVVFLWLFLQFYRGAYHKKKEV
ncbi:Elongation of very long chain fatty acids protein F [Gryllus bimaculatus]|nr:Elongation of very long chain fatty acids protein F [Gryllus bimaculatus]